MTRRSMPPLEYIDASKIKETIQGHWATQDDFFSIKNVDALETKLAEKGVKYEFRRYLARHAFAGAIGVG